jgi:endonuclease-8
MPEGDTIHRSAAALRSALRGRRVIAFDTTVPQVRARAPGRLVGRTVADVEARGKHLLHWFAPGDLALRTQCA